MPDLFQLPNGSRVRKGSAFNMEIPRTIVEPAIVGTDKAGNQHIEKAARETESSSSQYFPDNWLHVATPAMLEVLGIVALEEEQPADPRFYFSNEGPVKKGVVTQVVTPRDIEDIQRSLTSEIKELARGTILARFSIEKQQTMSMRLAAIERLRAAGDAVGDDQNELYDQILADQGWIEDVLMHGQDLELEVAKLRTAKAAETWYSKPWDWPEYDE